jgi:[ribosomal protein S5]-alanine N-acetyltransferase
MEVKTERLLIRELRNEDLNDLVEQVNNLNVSRNLLLVPHPYTEKDGKCFVDYCAENRDKNPRENYELAIELVNEGKLIGMVGLTGVDKF